MRRLRQHQPVTITLDDSSAVLEGTLDRVAGPVARLRSLRELAKDVKARLRVGSLGYLVFEHGGAPVGLRGVATADQKPRAVDFVVVDGVQVAERRGAERVPLIARTRLFDPVGAASEAIETVTANVSLGGAMLTLRPGVPVNGDLQLELFVGAGADPIRCCASVVRRTPTHVGVRFVDLADADQIRLATVIAERVR